MAKEIVVLNGKEEGLSKEQALEIQVVRYLRRIGINSSIKGYNYLKTAIIMTLEDETITDRITKELYPEVAKKNGTSSSKVERAIRHAIENGWRRGEEKFLKEVFGNTVSPITGRPTNREFIITVAEEIRISQFK